MGAKRKYPDGFLYRVVSPGRKPVFTQEPIRIANLAAHHPGTEVQTASFDDIVWQDFEVPEPYRRRVPEPLPCEHCEGPPQEWEAITQSSVEPVRTVMLDGHESCRIRRSDSGYNGTLCCCKDRSTWR